MSVLEHLVGRRFWVGLLWTIAVLLAVTALGALLVMWGVLSVGRAWIWTGVAWCAAGLCGGRFNASGERDTWVLGVIRVLLAVSVMWLIGLTMPGGENDQMQRWPYYIGAALMGALVPVWPRKRGRRKKGKGRSAARRR